ncbi:hypothetical protein BHM03_00030662, partial [Ensete ventricosum]
SSFSQKDCLNPSCPLYAAAIAVAPTWVAGLRAIGDCRGVAAPATSAAALGELRHSPRRYRGDQIH